MFSFLSSAGQALGLTAKAAAAPALTPDPANQAAVDAARGEALTAMIHSLKLPISALQITVQGEVATLRGAAVDQATREKCVLMCGNTVGIGSVDDQLTVETPAPPAVFHTVVAGDTLSKIARDQYGVLRLYDALFEANRPMLAHPDTIYPGQVLRIPPVSPPVHIVAKAETLGVIAKHWYGSAAKYTAIFEANTDKLKDANSVDVGQALTIPLLHCKPELIA